MSVRKLGLVIAAVCAALLIVPVAASAQSTPTPVSVTSFKHIPITGTANNGKAFTGHFNVSQFVTRNGKAYALGTLTGKLGYRTINRSNVAIPVSMGCGTSTGLTAHAAATCQILNLVLGPLHLNLLGLHVDLNQVILNVTGVTGTGQLLGNLLCGVANLLNPGLPAGQLAGLLNIVQQILSLPGLANL
jgi:opacity protein-like surface antigen